MQLSQVLRWASRHLKWVSLALLVLQNTALVLLMRYSRTVQGPMYITSTAVFNMEVVKLVACSAVIYMETGGWTAFKRKLRIEVVSKPLEVLKLAVPSFLYMVQNNLLYIALSNLDAATYSVCYQTKIITTALFSKWILRKYLTPVQWQALLLLFVGVALAETGSHFGGGAAATHTSVAEAAAVAAAAAAKSAVAGFVGDEAGGLLGGEAVNDGADGPQAAAVAAAAAAAAVTAGVNGLREQNHLWGFTCVLLAACTSGFAGVYFELMLKSARASLWIRNIQMGVPSVVLALGSVFVSDRQKVSELGFFHGYSFVVFSVILLQAVGGLVVAVVVKYADNILKGFAAGFSILTSCALSAWLFAFRPSWAFAAGAALVIVSTFMYVAAPPPKATAVAGGANGGGGSGAGSLLPLHSVPPNLKPGKGGN